MKETVCEHCGVRFKYRSTVRKGRRRRFCTIKCRDLGCCERGRPAHVLVSDEDIQKIKRLRYQRKLSYRAIARIMKCSESVVFKRFKAMEKEEV